MQNVKPRHFIIALCFATTACAPSPTETEIDFQTPEPLPDPLLITGQVRMNGVPRAARVELRQMVSVGCGFGALGCIPWSKSLVVATSATDEDGTFGLSGFWKGGSPIRCVGELAVSASLTDVGLEGIRGYGDFPAEVCGAVEGDIAFSYVAVQGIVRVDGVPVDSATIYDDLAKVRVYYPNGTTKVVTAGSDGLGGYHYAVSRRGDGTELCSALAGAELDVELNDGRTSERHPLRPLTEEECLTRPILDLDVEFVSASGSG